MGAFGGIILTSPTMRCPSLDRVEPELKLREVTPGKLRSP